MSRCGCAGACACAVVGETGIVVDGTGSPADPWRVSATGPEDCNASLDCLNGHLGNGLTYDTATHRLAVKFSTQSGNTAGAGSDGGVYVPPAGTVGSAAIIPQDTATIHLYGDGTTNNKLRADLIGGGRAYVKNSTDMTFSGSGTDADRITASRIGLYAYAVGTGAMAVTGTQKKFPVDLVDSRYSKAGVAHAASGNLVVDLAGVYSINVRGRFDLGTDVSVGFITMVGSVPALVGTAFGVPHHTSMAIINAVRKISAGQAFSFNAWGYGGSGMNIISMEIELGFIGK